MNMEAKRDARKEEQAESKKTAKRPCERPFIGEEIVLRTGSPVLAGSPPVQPGGGGGGSISIEDPISDPGDDNLVGAWKSGFHADWAD